MTTSIRIDLAEEEIVFGCTVLILLKRWTFANTPKGYVPYKWLYKRMQDDYGKAFMTNLQFHRLVRKLMIAGLVVDCYGHFGLTPLGRHEAIKSQRILEDMPCQ